jgi:phosphoribosylaminoimidazole-succinocarboxamide synthase
MTDLANVVPGACTDVHLDLPDRRAGKVRVSYRLPDDRRLLVTTDRLSVFDRVVAAVMPKGQVLNQLSWWWFDNTRDIVANHALGQPDPNATVVVDAIPLPVEVVVRARLTGSTSTSLLTQYLAGGRRLYGYDLPDGMTPHQALPHPIITPTTKADFGQHDEPITVAEVVSRGLLDADLWDEVQAAALAVFERGQKLAEQTGLILADTKYEFGLAPDGTLLLIDEVHTPDSSRFWVGATLEARLAAGREPESLDKEPARLAFKAAGYRGDGPVPRLDPTVWAETQHRYIDAYERITGLPFEPGDTPVPARLHANLVAAGLL